MKGLVSFCDAIRGNLAHESLDIACAAFAKSWYLENPNIGPQILEQISPANDAVFLQVCFLYLEQAGGNVEDLVKVLLSLPQNNEALTKVVSRMGGARSLSQLIPVFVTNESDDDEWMDDDENAARLARAISLMRVAAADNAVREKVLPVWLQQLSHPKASHARKDAIISSLHVFFNPGSVADMEDLWKAAENSPPKLGMALLCRVAPNLPSSHWLQWLRQAPFWTFLYNRFREAVVVKNTPQSFSKQAVFVFRCAVEVCLRERVQVSCEPFMVWDAKFDKDALADWDRWFQLFDILEEYSIHLIEPVWPNFQNIATKGRIPKIWVQLLLQKALVHDSIHVTRLVLLFLFQMKPEDLGWLDAEFFAGPLLCCTLVPALYRGYGGVAFLELVEKFWKIQFGSPQSLSLCKRIASELWPANPSLHHNVDGVGLLLRFLALAKHPIIDDARIVGKVLLLGRAHYCLQDAWKVCVECCGGFSANQSWADVLDRLRPHAVEFVTQYPSLARQFALRAGLFERPLPVSDPEGLAVVAFCSPQPGKILQLDESENGLALTALARFCPGGLAEVKRLLGPEYKAARCPFGAVLAGDISGAGNDLEWIEALTDPYFAGQGLAQGVAEGYVQKLCSLPSSPLKWKCLRQVATYSKSDAAARHAAASLADVMIHIDSTSLNDVYQTIATCKDPAVVVDEDVKKALLNRFAETISLKDNAEATFLMDDWAKVAVGSIGVKALEAIGTAETAHERFAGATGRAVHNVCAPIWKASLKDSVWSGVDAKVLAFILRSSGAPPNHSSARAVAAVWIRELHAERDPRVSQKMIEVVVELLHLAVQDKRTLEKGKESARVATQFAGSPWHKLQVRTWQAATLAMGKVCSEHVQQVPAIVDQLKELLLNGLFLPSLTVYMESFLSEFLFKFPSLISSFLLVELRNFSLKTAQAKILLASAYSMLMRGEKLGSVVLTELAAAVLPFLNAVQNPVRSRVVYICQAICKETWLLALLDPKVRWAVEMVTFYNSHCGDLSRKVDKTEDDWLDRFIGKPSFKVIFYDIPIRAPEIIGEALLPEDVRAAAKALEVDAANEDEALFEETREKERRKAIQQTAVATATVPAPVAEDSGHQRKIVPWHMLRLDESQARGAVVEHGPRLPMVVCASFLDRAPNIGGLTRTCEVFGVESITIADMSVMNTKDYQAVAVTADKWIRTEHVPVDRLEEWLLMMKNERGYALVGLEQTSTSQSIVDFVFPEKCVLVLGNELQGLPAPFLAMLTCVVEIPQLGTIRSLNVHVSASIMVASYVFQSLKRKK